MWRFCELQSGFQKVRWTLRNSTLKMLTFLRISKSSINHHLIIVENLIHYARLEGLLMNVWEILNLNLEKNPFSCDACISPEHGYTICQGERMCQNAVCRNFHMEACDKCDVNQQVTKNEETRCRAELLCMSMYQYVSLLEDPLRLMVPLTICARIRSRTYLCRNLGQWDILLLNFTSIHFTNFI